MARKSTEEVSVNMTPMIDIVFQLIIFFVVTTELDKQRFNESIVLAYSPNGPAIEQQDPRTIVIDVDKKGDISISRNSMSVQRLTHMLRNAVAQYGKYGTAIPIQIRGDRNTRHDSMRQVMEACGQAGLWRVSFVAVKEKAKKKQ